MRQKVFLDPSPNWEFAPREEERAKPPRMVSVQGMDATANRTPGHTYNTSPCCHRPRRPPEGSRAGPRLQRCSLRGANTKSSKGSHVPPELAERSTAVEEPSSHFYRFNCRDAHPLSASPPTLSFPSTSRTPSCLSTHRFHFRSLSV